MSIAEEAVREIVAINGGNPRAPVSKSRLQELTSGRYAGSGANGALFGFRQPWLIRRGDQRYLTDAGTRRLGLLP